MTQQITTYGLIGHPLGHSFSYLYFSTKFSEEYIHAQYLNFEIPTSADLGKSLESVLQAHPTLKGFNVTVPYKETIIPLLDEIHPTARRIGAVNTVRVDRADGQIKLTGYNTDYIGFRDSISDFLKPHHTEALILGTGGASKAVAYALAELGINYTFVSRTGRNGCLTYPELTPEVMKRHTVIVNATPLGTFPNVDTAPDIPYTELSARHLCYDLVYNPAMTKFMRLAEENGAEAMNGSAMLMLQAEHAWKFWNKTTTNRQ